MKSCLSFSSLKTKEKKKKKKRFNFASVGELADEVRRRYGRRQLAGVSNDLRVAALNLHIARTFEASGEVCRNTKERRDFSTALTRNGGPYGEAVKGEIAGTFRARWFVYAVWTPARNLAFTSARNNNTYEPAVSCPGEKYNQRGTPFRAE